MGETKDVAARKSRVDLETTEGIEKLSKRIRASYARITKRTGGADDCVQEVLCRMFEGKHLHSTIDQCVIDYLRTHSGRKGAPFYASRLNLINANSIGPGPDGDPSGLGNRGVEFDPRSSEGFEGSNWLKSVTGGLSREERIIVFLKVNWGFNETEIGDLFGVGGSRICQRFKGIQGRLSARIKAQKGAGVQGDASKKVAQILRPEAERQLWGVGEITFERMETGESFSVESFNEKSF